MSGDCGWCTIINNPREEARVALEGSETHIFHNLCTNIVPVLMRSMQAVECFVEELEVFRSGVRISEGWADDDDIVLWE